MIEYKEIHGRLYTRCAAIKFLTKTEEQNGGDKMSLSGKDLAKLIQHTDVNPDLTKNEVIQLCQDCVEYGFDGVMLQPCWIPLAKEQLKDTNVKVCTALGYPMGGSTTESKVFETKQAFELGADQLDFMANIGFLKSGMYDEYKSEIRQIVEAANGRVTKIMLEFGMLTQEEKVKAADLALEAGVTYLKNSSGWGKGGAATIEDIKLLKDIAGDKALVKASGGIRNAEQANAIIEAGASIIGTSSGVAIVTGEGKVGNY
jgi:deoxyribose-phosphate aldolase